MNYWIHALASHRNRVDVVVVVVVVVGIVVGVVVVVAVVGIVGIVVQRVCRTARSSTTLVHPLPVVHKQNHQHYHQHVLSMDYLQAAGTGGVHRGGEGLRNDAMMCPLRMTSRGKTSHPVVLLL